MLVKSEKAVKHRNKPNRMSDTEFIIPCEECHHLRRNFIFFTSLP